jgi:predicted DNA-binding transcriptional regulator YafY
MTSAQLATELEVVPRTILRDVDALTEAGLPVIVHQGNQGGIELGFNYRTRLTGFAADEAEAMAVILARPIPELEALGMAEAAHRARVKMLESFPDQVRMAVEHSQRRFAFAPLSTAPPDPRISAMAHAIRHSRIVRLHARTPAPRIIHPIRLVAAADDWRVVDALDQLTPIALSRWGDINISAHGFCV